MSSRYEDNLIAMLVHLEPIVHDCIRAEVDRNPAFATTSAVVVADVTAIWGRRLVANVLREDLPRDAVARCGATLSTAIAVERVHSR